MRIDRFFQLPVFAVFGIMLAGNAMANQDLARAKNCFSCHTTTTKLIGPGYREVASRYAGQAGAEEKLVQKVLRGGTGVWGQTPMPSNNQVTEAEARTLVKWILSTK